MTGRPRVRGQHVPDDCPLSVRQFDAVAALVDGQSYQQQALSLGVPESTVRNRLHEAYQHLGVTNSTQAIVACLSRGWLVVRDGQVTAEKQPEQCVDCGATITTVGFARHSRRIARDLGPDAGEYIGMACAECQGEGIATAAQRVYLYALDAYNRCHRDPEQRAALRLIMDRARDDAGITHSSEGAAA